MVLTINVFSNQNFRQIIIFVSAFVKLNKKRVQQSVLLLPFEYYVCTFKIYASIVYTVFGKNGCGKNSRSYFMNTSIFDDFPKILFLKDTESYKDYGFYDFTFLNFKNSQTFFDNDIIINRHYANTEIS